MEILTTITPYATEILSVVIAMAIAIAASRLHRWIGIEIEKRHREALHAALLSGALAAVAEGPRAGIEVLRQAAIDHAIASVPDAIRALLPSDEVLRTIAERYVREAIAHAA